jgi:hypothetical protein
MAKSPKEPKAQKPRQHKPTKGDMLNEANDLLNRIEATVDELDASEAELFKRSESRKRQKEVVGEIRERLAKLIRARKEAHPLFDPPKPATEQAAEEQAAAPLFDAAEKGDVDGLGVNRMDLPKGVLTKLAKADILTIGDLRKHVNAHGDFWVKNLPGIGPEAGAKIGEAWSKFCDANPAK